jgi:hypothetical protein
MARRCARQTSGGIKVMSKQAGPETLCLPDEDKPAEGGDLARAPVPMVPSEHPA